jgi:hypothetical protein
MDESTDIQNACVEAAQETEGGMVCADDVVKYVNSLLDKDETATIARPISKSQVSRTLQKLHNWGIMKREPRGSWGWGQGWQPSYYVIDPRQKGLLSRP